MQTIQILSAFLLGLGLVYYTIPIILIISAHKKFTAQILSALILIILGDMRFTNLHGMLGFHEINYASSVFISLLSIVAIINAQNLIDGIDGIAASIGSLSPQNQPDTNNSQSVHHRDCFYIPDYQ